MRWPDGETCNEDIIEELCGAAGKATRPLWHFSRTDEECHQCEKSGSPPPTLDSEDGHLQLEKGPSLAPVGVTRVFCVFSVCAKKSAGTTITSKDIV